MARDGREVLLLILENKSVISYLLLIVIFYHFLVEMVVAVDGNGSRSS